jgi:putative membrane protein
MGGRPPSTVPDLPLLNAVLNRTAAVLLVAGYSQIRRRRRDLHRALMIAAFVVSALFLLSYTVYHAQAGSRPFTVQGVLRLAYFVILISHVVLAAAVLPLALVTLARAWKGRFSAHARLARWTLPVWLYVSVTGVVVYLMLYRM